MLQLEEMLSTIESIFGSSMLSKIIAGIVLIWYIIHVLSTKKLIKKQANNTIKENKIKVMADNPIQNNTAEQLLHENESALEEYLNRRDK